RGVEERTWVLAPKPWGAVGLPNLSPALSAIERDAQRLRQEGRPSEAAARYRTASEQVRSSRPSWLAAWFLYRAAHTMALAKEWQEADAAYQRSVDLVPGEPDIASAILRERADTLEARGDLDGAERCYVESLARARADT